MLHIKFRLHVLDFFFNKIWDKKTDETFVM